MGVLTTMRVAIPDRSHVRVATFDIETTSVDARSGQLVSIGVAVHERGTSLSNARVKLFHRRPQRDEECIIRQAYGWLDDQDADVLVTYNGKSFDLSFVDVRMKELGERPIRPALDTAGGHIDLLMDYRTDAAERAGVKWPKLEETIESYTDEVPPTVEWRGDELTNTRFGEELGPAYIEAVESEDAIEMAFLESVIDAYLRQDLLLQLMIYYFDIGEYAREDGAQAEEPVPINSSLSEWESV